MLLHVRGRDYCVVNVACRLSMRNLPYILLLSMRNLPHVLFLSMRNSVPGDYNNKLAQGRCENFLRSTTMTIDKSSRGWLMLAILSSIHLCVTGTSLCVARHHSGDEFVNEGGAISSCSVYGASCAIESSLIDGEERCSCDINEAPRPCPACKCNSIYPVFNGTQCKSSFN